MEKIQGSVGVTFSRFMNESRASWLPQYSMVFSLEPQTQLPRETTVERGKEEASLPVQHVEHKK